MSSIVTSSSRSRRGRTREVYVCTVQTYRKDVGMEQRTDRPGPGRPMVTGIDHAGITVSSLERSLAFYRDLLGLRVIEISGEEDIGEIIGIEGARIRAADLDAGDGRIIELLEYVDGSAGRHPQQPNGIGCPHVAL